MLHLRADAALSTDEAPNRDDDAADISSRRLTDMRRILLADFGNFGDAVTYADRIGAVVGPLSAQYQALAGFMREHKFCDHKVQKGVFCPPCYLTHMPRAKP